MQVVALLELVPQLIIMYNKWDIALSALDQIEDVSPRVAEARAVMAQYCTIFVGAFVIIFAGTANRNLLPCTPAYCERITIYLADVDGAVLVTLRGSCKTHQEPHSQRPPKLFQGLDSLAFLTLLPRR